MIVPIRSLTPIVSRSDTTEVGLATTMAKNAIFRPRGAFKSPPKLLKLWGFGGSATPLNTILGLAHPVSGVIDTSHETVCVRIYHQGINLVMFFNVTAAGSVTTGERGTFYIGNDGSHSGEVDFSDEGPPLFQVLATNLDPSARWYGEMQSGQLMAQNGVDDPVAIQLGRTAAPGIYRKRGTNATLAAPVISAIEPVASTNAQAKRTVTGRAGGVNLVFTAHPTNFAGQNGNNRLRVNIEWLGAYSSGPIASTASGEGTVGSPFVYTIFTTASNSSNNAIIAFVNSDSKALPFLSASGADASADYYDDSTLGTTISQQTLSGGAGTGVSIGLTSEIIDVYARMWDGGYKNCGYESPSSPVSNEIILDALTFKDILVQVDIDEDAEGGRFSHANAGIRIYKRYGGDTDPVWNLMNEDTILPNTHRQQRVLVASTDLPMWVGSAHVTCTYLSLSNQFLLTGVATNGQQVILPAAIPGLSSGTRMYVVGASELTPGVTQFGLSATAGGSAIDFGTAYAANADHLLNEILVTGSVANGQIFRIDTNSVGLPTLTNLYVINAVAVGPDTTIQLSLSSGGAASVLSATGSINLHTVVSGTKLHFGATSGDRVYSSETSFREQSIEVNATTNELEVGVAVQNGDILVADVDANGLPANVKLVVINAQADTPSAGSTTFQLALHATGDPLDITAGGYVNLHRLATNLWTTSDIVIFPNEGGAAAPTGAALDTRYFILSKDEDGFGMQLSTSRLGSALPFTSQGSNLAMKAMAVSMVIGSNAEPGRGMSLDQNRPPPHRYITMAGGFNWCAGVPENETKLYSSSDVESDMVAPEGVNLEDVDLISKSRGMAISRVSGLWSDKQSLHVHFDDGIVIIDPDDTSSQQEPLVEAGMVNGACATIASGNKIMFLGANRQIMEFNGARYGNRASSTLSPDAIAYIDQYVSQDEIVNNPDNCMTLHDKDNGMFWFWMPKSGGGTIGFAYDEIHGRVTGPFTAPCIAASAIKLEAARGKYLLVNGGGYIFYWDLFDQGDTGDNLTQSALTEHETDDSLPADHTGYDYNDITVGVETKRLWYSTHAKIETGYIDNGDQGSIKRFTGLRWRTIAGSRGYMKITAVTLSGLETEVWYGEIGVKQRNKPHQVSFSISDTAIKLRIEVFSAENKVWIVRDLELIIG